MSDLSTTYLGLRLRNPIVVGSSGLTGSLAKLQELEKNGAGAVVLKSLFGEDIERETEQIRREARGAGYDPEAIDLLDVQIQGEHLDATMELIAQAKRRLSIPVIASVNCTHAHEWELFARQLAGAGADALQLNVFVLPSDLDQSSEKQEQAYLDLVKRVVDRVKIPVALKISAYFTSLGATIQKLSRTGIAGMVLFNRFYRIDFDIERMQVVPTNRFSQPDEYTIPLRWVAIMANRVGCDLAASTGIHTAEAVIKQLLAGAKAVEMVSAVYQHGAGHVQAVLQQLDMWMTRHEYYEIDQFQGLMAQSESGNPAAYERAQFIKVYA